MGLSLFHKTYQRRKHENIQQKHHTDEKWIFFLKRVKTRLGVGRRTQTASGVLKKQLKGAEEIRPKPPTWKQMQKRK